MIFRNSDELGDNPLGRGKLLRGGGGGGPSRWSGDSVTLTQFP